MAITMEAETLNKKLGYTNELIEQTTINELINCCIDAPTTKNSYEAKEELINGGRDNIRNRIQIKKAFKNIIASLEDILKETDTEITGTNKGNLKSYKNRFLSILSILDKIQLEWQKHDLGIKFRN